MRTLYYTTPCFLFQCYLYALLCNAYKCILHDSRKLYAYAFYTFVPTEVPYSPTRVVSLLYRDIL